MSQKIEIVKVKNDLLVMAVHSYPKITFISLYIVGLKRFLNNMLCFFNIAYLTSYETYYIFISHNPNH